MMFVVKTLLLEDVVRDVLGKGCCYPRCFNQRMINVDTRNVVAKGHYCTLKMLLYEKLLPNQDIATKKFSTKSATIDFFSR
jgi:hypothetical protein